jgi:hypothetical protein
MVRSCVAQNCNSTALTKHSLLEFPKDAAICRQWIKFVQTKRANFTPALGKSRSVLCHDHFSPDCFESSLMYDLGYKSKRSLKKTAVPTIHKVLSSASSKRGRDIGACGGEVADCDAKKPVKRSRSVSKLTVARVSTISCMILHFTQTTHPCFIFTIQHCDKNCWHYIQRIDPLCIEWSRLKCYSSAGALPSHSPMFTSRMFVPIRGHHQRPKFLGLGYVYVCR